MNYRLLGLRLCEQKSQIGTVDGIVNEVIQVCTVFCFLYVWNLLHFSFHHSCILCFHKLVLCFSNLDFYFIFLYMEHLFPINYAFSIVCFYLLGVFFLQGQVVSQCGLDEYVKVVDAYLDIILQNHMVCLEVVFTCLCY